MKKKVPVVTVAEPDEAAHLAGLPLEATVALTDLAEAVKDGLLGFCADVGLMVMRQVMDDELARRIGPKNARLPERTANWHGTTTGPVVLGGRLLSVERPRGRTTSGEEIDLDSWGVFSSRDLLDQLTAERVLAGVATRRHADVCEPLRAGIDDKAKGTGRSSVSRPWKHATEAALAELMPATCPPWRWPWLWSTASMSLGDDCRRGVGEQRGRAPGAVRRRGRGRERFGNNCASTLLTL